LVDVNILTTVLHLLIQESVHSVQFFGMRESYVYHILAVKFASRIINRLDLDRMIPQHYGLRDVTLYSLVYRYRSLRMQ